MKSPISLNGIDFIEYSSSNPAELKKLWKRLGFVYRGSHKNKKVELFSQGYTFFVLNQEKNTFAEQFAKEHGPAVCALGFRVQKAEQAFNWAVSQGARPVETDLHSHQFFAVYGVGDSILYFIDQEHFKEDFLLEGSLYPDSKSVYPSQLLSIDHLTHNVSSGEMEKWCVFYKDIFDFTERRYFDIQGSHTGLISKVMRSPCSTITIPINEPALGDKGKKSQIQEFLDEYKGAGIQHIALTTKDIVSAVQKFRLKDLEFLDVPDTYYEDLPQRAIPIKESLSDLRENKILADGDEKGYLLQIFTKNVIGPIFYEIIQRHNHDGFGEGNFQALFSAIERDQIQRGFIK